MAGAEPRVAVDSTLVDDLLALTPEERLRQNDRMLRTIQELRDGFAAARAAARRILITSSSPTDR
jgi:hypothetical protein